jgi:hypothetical protein
MPTLIIDNIPQPLFEQIERPPQAPFLTDDSCAPCSIPRPSGPPVVPIEVVDYVPEPHDIPDVE